MIPKINNGNFITKSASKGTEKGQFLDPEHLAINKDGDVYVSDRRDNEVWYSHECLEVKFYILKVPLSSTDLYYQI